MQSGLIPAVYGDRRAAVVTGTAVLGTLAERLRMHVGAIAPVAACCLGSLARCLARGSQCEADIALSVCLDLSRNRAMATLVATGWGRWRAAVRPSDSSVQPGPVAGVCCTSSCGCSRQGAPPGQLVGNLSRFQVPLRRFSVEARATP